MARLAYIMDNHLNLFYSYNQDNELIENNLTRAFIVTLRTITSKIRNSLFHNLCDSFKVYDFSEADFALQSTNIDPMNFEGRYIVTLSSHKGFSWEHEYKELDKDIIKMALENKCCPADFGQSDLLQTLCYGSIPDAWIYDKHFKFCFLIECKKQGDCINYPQIMRHAYENFKLTDVEEIDKVTIKVTWCDIAAILTNIMKNKLFENNQEAAVIKNFVEYLSFFGYYHFEGMQLDGLLPVPDFSFSSKLHYLFRFNQIVIHPSFQLTSNKEIK